MSDDNKENLTVAKILFDGIKEYSFLHTGPLISKAIINAISKGVPGIGDFLKARCVVAKHQVIGEFPSIKDGLSIYEKLTNESAILTSESGDIVKIFYIDRELCFWD